MTIVDIALVTRLVREAAARAAPPPKTRFFGVPTPRGHAFRVQF